MRIQSCVSTNSFHILTLQLDAVNFVTQDSHHHVHLVTNVMVPPWQTLTFAVVAHNWQTDVMMVLPHMWRWVPPLQLLAMFSARIVRWATGNHLFSLYSLSSSLYWAECWGIFDKIFSCELSTSNGMYYCCPSSASAQCPTGRVAYINNGTPIECVIGTNTCPFGYTCTQSTSGSQALCCSLNQALEGPLCPYGVPYRFAGLYS